MDLGGAEQVVLHLARHLNRQRFAPLVACLTRPGRFSDSLAAEGIPVFCLEKRPKLDWRLCGRLRRLFKEQKVDLIHTHLFTANLWGRLAAWGTGVPVVVTEHSTDTWKGWFYRWLDRRMKSLTTQWVFVSPQVRDFYEGQMGPLPNAQVIYNGVPLAEPPTSKPPDAHPIVLAMVGRLVSEKEPRRFIELVARLSQEGLSVKGVLVGDGPERPALERAVAELQAENLVTLAGFVPDAKKIWEGVDLLCLTSSREGLPLSLLEAMARGIPVLATSVGGVPECLTDGVEGILVPFGDWEAFAREARRLIQDPELRRRLGEAGRARVQRQFRLEQMVTQHEALYARLLGPP